jgi:hypothetical protein
VLVPRVITPDIPAGSKAAQVKLVPVIVLLKITETEEEAEHKIWFVGENTTAGDGFIVIVKALDTPLQPFKLGVTVKLATMGLVPLLIAVNAGISPTPVAPIPIAGLLFVQLYAVFGIAPENKIAADDCPLHTVWLRGKTTVGVGLTVIVKVFGVPKQPFAFGVTVMVAVTDINPVFIAVKLAMLPLPTVAKPMDAVSFVQSKVVPEAFPEKLITPLEAVLHLTRFGIEFTVGVGLTVMSNVFDKPVQPLTNGVTLIVAITAVAPVFIAVNEGIVLVPEAAIPMLVLLDDQL